MNEMTLEDAITHLEGFCTCDECAWVKEIVEYRMVRIAHPCSACSEVLRAGEKALYHIIRWDELAKIRSYHIACAPPGLIGRGEKK